ncbi:hypothetical protein Hanom_Chr11g00993841 [Helianthus anomalus]
MIIVMAGGRKNAKIVGQGSSSGVGSASRLLPKKWEQLSSLEEGDARLYQQDWAWEKFWDSRSANVWNEDKNKALSKFVDKKLEIKLWKWKMVTGVSTSVPDRVVAERAVHVEELRAIGITQMFERLGWERVCECLATLKFQKKDGPSEQWRLVGTTSRGEMTKSFEIINCITRFDSLGVQAYDYPMMEHFFDNKANHHDPEGMIESVLPYNDGEVAAESHLTGKVRASDCRVIHALVYGTPTLSWRHIIMMNTWITRESFHRRMIPYVRLISAMILQQNCLPPSRFGNWKIQVQLFGSKYSVTDELGHKCEFIDPDAPQRAAEDVEMADEEDEDETAGPRGLKQRYMRPHRELNANVASFVNFRRVPSYRNFNRGQQEVFDNIFAGIGEGREYEARRKNWDLTH